MRTAGSTYTEAGRGPGDEGQGRLSGSLPRGWPGRSRGCREAASKGPGVEKIFGHGGLVGELWGRTRERGCVILHPDGWFQQQPRQVNSGAEARQAPHPLLDLCW